MEFRVHSVEESPPQQTFTAYVPVSRDEPDPWSDLDWQEPIIDAEVIHVGERRRARQPLQLSTVSFDDALEEDDVALDAPGYRRTVLRVDPEARGLLKGSNVVMATDVLGRVGRGIHLVGVPIRFVPDPGQQAWDSPIWLPVGRVHRPDYPECKSVYTVTETSTKEYDATFELGALGVSGATKFSVSFKRTLPAMESCKEAAVRARLVIRFGTTYLGKKPLFSGAHIEIRDVNTKDREYRDVPPELDQCGWKPDAIPKQEPTIERLSRATGGVDDAPTDELAIEREANGRMSLGLDFNRVPAKFSVAFTRTCEHRTALETRMMPGADYLGYLPRLDNPMEKCWTVLRRSKRASRSARARRS
jgi:hypothetical protein